MARHPVCPKCLSQTVEGFGGCFTTVKPSQHSLTAADIIARFTGQRFGFSQQENGTHLVELA